MRWFPVIRQTVLTKMIYSTTLSLLQ